MSHDCTEQSPRFFREQVKKPISYRELTERLRLRGGERKPVKKLLRDLVNSGEIIKNRKGLYGLPAEMSLVTGYFEAHRTDTDCDIRETG
jgi:ribonuclease R